MKVNNWFIGCLIVLLILWYMSVPGDSRRIIQETKEEAKHS